MPSRSPTNFMRRQERAVQFEGSGVISGKFRPLINNATEPPHKLKLGSHLE
jgi:hypothetical protein